MNTRLEAIIANLPSGSWVRALSVHHIAGGVEVRFAVLRSRRGKPIAMLSVACRHVRELSVSDLDGGGLRLYSADHPAARQYSAGRARLRWRPESRGHEAMGVLLAAHTRLVDDWIPFERYSSPLRPRGSLVTWHGPPFIMQAYARALRALGLVANVHMSKRTRQRRRRSRCLHFGNSFVVADGFEIISGAT